MDKKEKRYFTICDFPEKGKNTGKYSGENPAQVATKVFNKLAKHYNFYNNYGGTKYLVFNILDLGSRKVYSFIGTPVVLHEPIEVNLRNKTLKITHRNIVAKYDKDMQEVFKREPEKSM